MKKCDVIEMFLATAMTATNRTAAPSMNMAASLFRNLSDLKYLTRRISIFTISMLSSVAMAR